ncbi:hypothetical protein FQN60_003080 [Etheostoma spectabile]|uniref:Uncharacterized protein n=1 Tax=Etheostoma spectabile TaxID=54343 RepID=A0A5J5CL99_9PERO|nr:hypothetical protein FQN60_003080 [Etheostoma spectabile]
MTAQRRRVGMDGWMEKNPKAAALRKHTASQACPLSARYKGATGIQGRESLEGIKMVAAPENAPARIQGFKNTEIKD